MTREGEVLVLREHLEACERLGESLALVEAEMASLAPIDGPTVKALAARDRLTVLAFLKAFEQFEDTLGRTLKTVALLMTFGKPERLAPRDVARRAEALGIFDDARAWSDAVRARNELAHEYPLRPDKQAGQINKAWEMRGVLSDTLARIRAFVDKEGLLNGDL